MNEAGGGGGTRARRRLRGFGAHLAAYFAVLAVHAAYAMGLLDVFRGK
jgi:hypothetical protein